MAGLPVSCLKSSIVLFPKITFLTSKIFEESKFMMAGVLNWFWFAGAGCACAWLVVMVAYYKRRNILKNEM